MLNAAAEIAGRSAAVGQIAVVEERTVVVGIAGEGMAEGRELPWQHHIHDLAVGSYDRLEGRHSSWRVSFGLSWANLRSSWRNQVAVGGSNWLETAA